MRLCGRSPHALALLVVIVLCLPAAAGDLRAQPAAAAAASPSGARASQAPPAAQAPAPKPPTWNANLSFNFMHIQSNSEVNNITISGMALALRGRTRYLAYGDVNYQTFEQKPVVPKSTVNDADRVRLILSHDFTRRVHLLASGSYKRSAPQGVEYAADQLVGLGIRWDKPGQAAFDVAVVGGATEQDKNLAAADGTNVTYGMLQTLSGRHGNWQWDQSLVFLQNSKLGRDRRIQFSGTLIGRIAGPVGVNLAYRLDREAAVARGGRPKTQTLSAGVSLTLPYVRTRPPAP